jgi:hypothetical protein
MTKAAIVGDAKFVNELLSVGDKDRDKAAQAILAEVRKRHNTEEYRQKVRDLTEQYIQAQEDADYEFYSVSEAPTDAVEDEAAMDAFHMAQARKMASEDDEEYRVKVNTDGLNSNEKVVRVVFDSTGLNYEDAEMDCN